MAINGVRLTDNFVADQRPKDWREGILLLFPNGKSPLFALTAGLKKKTAVDPEFHWWDKVMPTQRFVVTDATTTATTVGHAAGAAFNAGIHIGTIIRIEETEEMVRVTAEPAAANTTTTIVRAWGGTTATALTDATGVNMNVQSVGVAFAENSTPPAGVNMDPEKRTNYTQIFRDTLEMSRTAMHTRLRTGDAVREAKRECLEFHSANVERALWFGQADETAIGGVIARATGGVFSFIDGTNVISATTAVDMVYLENWMEQAFRYGSSEKMGFCGNEALLQIQRTIRLATGGSYELIQGQKEYGMNVSRLVSPFGEVILKSHPLWNQITGGTNTTAYYGVNSWLCILDMAELVYRPLEAGDTQYQPKLQANGLDGVQSGYLTECGLEMHHPLSHMLIKGINSAAAG